MVKILHLADIHLDSPFSLRTPSEAERLRTEMRGAFTSACLFAKSNGIGIVLIAGDLFDSEYVTADTRDLLIKTFASCKDIKFFITPGNHDPLTPNSIYKTAKFPENVHIFSEKPGCVRLPELGVCIYGRAFTSRTMEQSPVVGYGELDKDMINILVCHGDMSPLSTIGPITKAEIAASGFDYVAMGHIHKGSGLQKEGDTYWCYPGCMVGRSFDETGKKGGMVGFVGKGECDMRFLPLSKRIYEISTLSVSGDKDEVLSAIRAHAKQFDPDTALRLILTGVTNDGATFTSEEIGASCAIELIDRTSPADNFTELEKSNTLKGVFYRMMRDKIDALTPGSDEYYTALSALKLGMAALSDRSIADDCTEED